MTSSSQPFDLVHRGYACNQVDAYLAAVDAAFTENAQRIDDLENKLTRLRQELADHKRRNRPGATSMGDRIAELLRLAEQEAAQLRRDARTEREQVIADARARAARIVATATDDVDVIRRDARAEAEKVHAELDADRRALDRQRAAIDQRIAALRGALAKATAIELDARDVR